MKFILHSVSYSQTWKGQIGLSLDDIIKKAADLGFDGIELMAKRPHASPIDLSKELRKDLKRKIEHSGLQLACIAGYQDFSTDLDHPDMPKIEKELLYLRETIKLASDLDCKIVRIYSGFLRPDVSYDAQWDWCVKYIKEASKYAEDKGVFLALQNHSEITIHHLDLLQMIREIDSPAMKVALDAPYVVRTGVPLEKAVVDVSPLLMYSTASDHIHRRISFHLAPSQFKMTGYYSFTRTLTTPIGDGEIDYYIFFKALKSVGYDSYMAYEICSPIIGGGSESNLDLCARNSLKRLKEIYREVYTS